jgi:23S rRNA (cytosine1962-C5)-methyltransferase
MLNTEIVQSWQDYELIDSGDGERLERFGPYRIARPDGNVLWSRNEKAPWGQEDAHFIKGEKGQWDLRSPNLASGWKIQYKKATFRVAPTPFRHLGIFPEQSAHWDWLEEKVRSAGSPVKVLNLFAYTGAASVIGALAGAKVTHVDASMGSVNWAKENAKLSGLPEDAIRWIVDDVPKFLAREIRRGSKYDLILLDPPVFGRGPKGEIWRLEEGIHGLIDQVRQLLSPESVGVLVNFYATALYPESIARVVSESLGAKGKDLQLGSLCLEENTTKKLLPTGFFLRS